MHARRMTLDLVDLYAKEAETTEALKLASRVLTGMAAEVYGSGAHISAQSMFSRAVELDETNGVAMLGLGFMYENTGRGDTQTPKYEDAVRMLERAVAVAPELHEARLRLAVNLGRLERGWDGGKHLQLLIDREDVPPWILSLAYQELARLYNSDRRVHAGPAGAGARRQAVATRTPSCRCSWHMSTSDASSNTRRTRRPIAPPARAFRRDSSTFRCRSYWRSPRWLGPPLRSSVYRRWRQLSDPDRREWVADAPRRPGPSYCFWLRRSCGPRTSTVAILEPSSNTPVFGEVDFVINIYPEDTEIDPGGVPDGRLSGRGAH